MLGDYLPYITTVRVRARAPRTPLCRDPFDLPFLRLAVAGKADNLVTGNRDPLSLTAEFSCPIVTATQYLDALAKA